MKKDSTLVKIALFGLLTIAVWTGYLATRHAGSPGGTFDIRYGFDSIQSLLFIITINSFRKKSDDSIQ